MQDFVHQQQDRQDSQSSQKPVRIIQRLVNKMLGRRIVLRRFQSLSRDRVMCTRGKHSKGYLCHEDEPFEAYAKFKKSGFGLGGNVPTRYMHLA